MQIFTQVTVSSNIFNSFLYKYLSKLFGVQFYIPYPGQILPKQIVATDSLADNSVAD